MEMEGKCEVRTDEERNVNEMNKSVFFLFFFFWFYLSSVLLFVFVSFFNQ